MHVSEILQWMESSNLTVSNMLLGGFAAYFAWSLVRRGVSAASTIVGKAAGLAKAFPLIPLTAVLLATGGTTLTGLGVGEVKSGPVAPATARLDEKTIQVALDKTDPKDTVKLVAMFMDEQEKLRAAPQVGTQPYDYALPYAKLGFGLALVACSVLMFTRMK